MTFDSQRYEVQAGFLSASQGGGVPISIDGGELVDQDRDLMLPWSGRAWVLLNSSEVEDDQGGGLRPTGIFSSGELILRDVDFAISGTVSSGD